MSAIKARTEIAKDLPALHGALLNLVSNAIKYSAPGNEVKLCAEATKDGVVLKAWNPGPALPQGELARLLEPFYRRNQQEETTRGWGIGLAFVKRVVRSAYFCLFLFWITTGAAVGQEQQPSSAPATAAIAGATIAEWKGNVRLSLPGQATSNPLRGEQLPSGTVLDTGGGKLLLRLGDGSEVLVRSHTRLQVQQPSLTDPSYFQLLLGQIRALVNKRTGGAGPFELGTPSAVIAVRGTQFDVEVNLHNVTEVDVVDGLVEVYGRNAGGGSVLLEPGFSTRVALDSDPEQPEPTNEMRPDVERSEPGENEMRGKSEFEYEFERTEVDRDVESRESAELAEMREIQEIPEQTSVSVEADFKPGSEPQ